MGSFQAPHFGVHTRDDHTPARVYFEEEFYGVQGRSQELVHAQKTPYTDLQARFFPKFPFQCLVYRFTKFYASTRRCPPFPGLSQPLVPDQQQLIVGQAKTTDADAQLMTEHIMNFFTNFVHDQLRFDR
jgi:hypothetical protein